MTERTGEQLSVEGCEKKIKSCAFSGHRILGEDFDEKKLENEVRVLAESGTETFYCGMAEGFDLRAAECVLRLKKEYPLKLIACIPCAGQEKYFKEEEKKKYYEILEQCDLKTVLAESYYKWCMVKRNDYMEERSNALIAYCRKETGGTAYTVRRFLKKKKPVFEV